MRDRTKKRVKWISGAIAVAWMGLIGLDQFNDLGTFSYGDSAGEDKTEMLMKECRGTFNERYNCKSSILRNKGRDTFRYWGKKWAVTFAPPIFLYIAFHLWLGRVETVEEKDRRERRVLRIELARQKERRMANEQGRQRTLAARRKQDVREAEVRALREEMKRPLNVMVICQDEELVNSLAEPLWQSGYLAIPTDLLDVFSVYREIGYHIVLTDTQIDAPDIDPEDLADEKYPGNRLPLDETIRQLRERKSNIRIVAMSGDFAGLEAKEYIKTATEMGVDALIEKPIDMEKLGDLFEKLMDTGVKSDEDEV
ncbi:MAG: hypothetical protein HQ503_14625 [Rhodospirillales bacterium]|nr:hypothetical protein [Rhodospirillales bacterium]